MFFVVCMYRQYFLHMAEMDWIVNYIIIFNYISDKIKQHSILFNFVHAYKDSKNRGNTSKVYSKTILMLNLMYLTMILWQKTKYHNICKTSEGEGSRQGAGTCVTDPTFLSHAHMSGVEKLSNKIEGCHTSNIN